MVHSKKIRDGSASQNNIRDGDERSGVGVDPGGLLYRGGSRHLPAEVAAVDEEVVGGDTQLETLAPLPAKASPHSQCCALVQETQAQFDNVELPQIADPCSEDAEQGEEEGEAAHQVDPGEEHGKGGGEGEKEVRVVEHC